MYKNLGYTIKSIARIGFWVLLAAVEIAGVIQIVRNFSYQYAFPSMLLSTLAVMAVAPGVLWLMSLALYTIGQMVENSDIRTDLAIKQAKGLAAPVPADLRQRAAARRGAGSRAHGVLSGGLPLVSAAQMKNGRLPVFLVARHGRRLIDVG